ncbi:MAG: AAC(3)-I family aminoglycoside N-acetyltransferase [Sphingomonadaceae bacterium]
MIESLVRRLGSNDLDAMYALLTVFAAAFEDDITYSSRRPDATYLGTLLGDKGFVALVAEQDGAVVGGLVAYELRKFEQARSEFYIYDLAVAESHRRQGIATALIEALKPIAAASGGWVVFVQADRDDAPAIALYETLGRREDVYHFDIAVPDALPIASDPSRLRD